MDDIPEDGGQAVHGALISQGVAGSCQFWLVDPDGNRLELMEYVPGAKQLE